MNVPKPAAYACVHRFAAPGNRTITTLLEHDAVIQNSSNSSDLVALTNKKLVKLLVAPLDMYMRAPDNDKACIINNVMHFWRELTPRGRFLLQHSTGVIVRLMMKMHLMILGLV